MSDLYAILTKHSYKVEKEEEYISITQDAGASAIGLMFSVGGGALGWYMGSQDPELEELENDPFITDSWFYHFFDFLGTLFIIGLCLVGAYMLYSVFKMATYQLNINKDKVQLNTIKGDFTWKWEDITGFSIDRISESLYVEHSSGEKKKLLEFYSKDKSGLKDLKEIKMILEGYCQLDKQS